VLSQNLWTSFISGSWIGKYTIHKSSGRSTNGYRSFFQGQTKIQIGKTALTDKLLFERHSNLIMSDMI